MARRLALTSLLVPDYDQAIAFFTGVLGFELRCDEALSPEKRWVIVAPSPDSAGLLLARAATDEQKAMIGKQGGGRVWLFLHTDDLARDVARIREARLELEGEPRTEDFGQVVVFKDIYGNRWDLIQPTEDTA